MLACFPEPMSIKMIKITAYKFGQLLISRLMDLKFVGVFFYLTLQHTINYAAIDKALVIFCGL
jgi:hypothetical protein